MNRSRACGPISTSMYIRPDAVILDVIRLEDREARMRFSILNIAMAIAIAALTVALVVDRINDQKIIRLMDQYSRHRFSLPTAFLDSRTRWNSEETQLPLPAGRAEAVAARFITDLASVNTEIYWQLESLNLVSINQSFNNWCYLVTIDGTEKYIARDGGPPITLSVLILFDETVVIPAERNYIDESPTYARLFASNYVIAK